MPRPRRPRLVQYVPDPHDSALFVLGQDEPDSGHWWDVRISDAIVGDYPSWRYEPPRKSKHPPFTAHEVAVAGAAELNEGRGLVTLTEYVGGLPVFAGAFVANGSQVYCVRSTDPSRAEPVCEAVEGLEERARKAFRERRAARARA